MAVNVASQSSSELIPSSARLVIKGIVQGVGFRPFLFRLASQMQLTGRVKNARDGVVMDVCCDTEIVDELKSRILEQAPLSAQIDRIDVSFLASPIQYSDFKVIKSDDDYIATDIPPDLALCDRCKTEILTPESRYQEFAFNSCPDCGPRYSMISAMPYDRPNTAMEQFPLCLECQRDYRDPDNRRFHGEGIGCPSCGPQLTFVEGTTLNHSTSESPLHNGAELLNQGKILAVKGVGGFHLCCDALNESAIQALRDKKYRPHKPLAVMMADVEHIRNYFDLDDTQVSILASKEAPILLLPKTQLKVPLPESVASGCAYIGVMLAYSPLHLLLINKVKKPLVMTSGNPKGEPLCVDNQQAFDSLNHIADGFLVNDRPINHRCDDSVLRLIGDQARFIRRARGFVPLGILTAVGSPESPQVLAMGGDLKNCFALTRANKVILSGHNGDLANLGCYQAMAKSVTTMGDLLQLSPQAVVVDKHPDYYSSRYGRKFAEQNSLPLIEVQHHHAHLAACLAERKLDPAEPVLGLVLDGLGYGDDGSMWGGELLLADLAESHRVARLKPFPLLGGDKANLQPWRNLLALLNQSEESDSLKALMADTELMEMVGSEDAQVLTQHASSFPLTSSAGRVFDAIAYCLADVPPEQSFEGQAAMALESLALSSTCDLEPVLFKINEYNGLFDLDPAPIWKPLLQALKDGKSKVQLAKWFHLSFVDSWVELISRLKEQGHYQGKTIALSGGVFQNKIILEQTQSKLTTLGFNVITHVSVPCNDGGIALGQAVIALKQLEKQSCV